MEVVTLHSPKTVNPAKFSREESSLVEKEVYFLIIFRIINSGTEYFVFMSFWKQSLETAFFWSIKDLKVLKRNKKIFGVSSGLSFNELKWIND